jgi:hypothetical protein
MDFDSGRWNIDVETLVAGGDVAGSVVLGLERGDSFAVIAARGMEKSTFLNAIYRQRLSSPLAGSVPLLIRITGREAGPYQLIDAIAGKLAEAVATSLSLPLGSVRSRLTGRLSPTTARPLLHMTALAREMLETDAALELIFDDFHRLAAHTWAADLLANLEDELFGSRDNPKMLRAVFAGDFRMKSLLQDLPFSDLWQYLRNVWLSSPDESVLIDLLVRSRLQGAEASKLASAVYAETGGHPSITRYVVRDVFESVVSDIQQTLAYSGLRFICEYGKLLETTWHSLPKSSQLLIEKAADRGGPIPIEGLVTGVSGGPSGFDTALRHALSTGFVRIRDGELLPPGKIQRAWFRAQAGSGLGAACESPMVLRRRAGGRRFPTILHLSDLHFGDKGHVWNDAGCIPGVARPDQDRLTLKGTLIARLRKLKSEDGDLWPSVVVVSGDLLFQCTKDGVDPAVQFLAGLCDELGIERRRVVLCPGNHDENRALRIEEPKARFAQYVEIWNRFYPSGIRRLSLDSKPGAYTDVFRIDNTEVLTLDSCEDLGGFGGEPTPGRQGYIGKAQMEVAADLLSVLGPEGDTVRIAVMHHHLSQYDWNTGPDYSILRESERVIRWMRKFSFDLVLHGHQHCAGLITRVEKSRYVTISAVGSAGVVPEFRWRGGMPLMYQLICSPDPETGRRHCEVFDLFEEAWRTSVQAADERFPLGRVSTT